MAESDNASKPLKSREKDSSVPGAAGYEQYAEAFISSSQALAFEQVCAAFLDYLPAPPARVLDLGAGAGQNAAALAARAYRVTAVEPLAVLLEASRESYSDLAVTWLQDSLPELACLHTEEASFDFVLLMGVWHHLQPAQRALALQRIARLMSSGGRCAMTLRNGPAGVGTCVFPTSVSETIAQAQAVGLHCVLELSGQPSIMPNKPEVVWAHILLEKP